MNPKNEITSRVEIVGPNDRPRKDPEQALREMVEREVAEILVTREAFVLEPFLRSRKVSNEIKRMQTVPEWQKWGRYFALWGCLICGARDSLHGGCGMCQHCYKRTANRLKTVIKSHKGRYEDGQYERLVHDQQNIAMQALAGEVKSEALPSLPAAEAPKEYLTQKQAAAAAGIDPKTLQLWIKNGDVQPPPRVSPKKWVWSALDIEELKLLKERKRATHNSKASLARWEKKKLPKGESQ